MTIQYNHSLLPYNTFGIDVKAAAFVEINSIETLQEVLKSDQKRPLFILGGGSNMLLTKKVNALVLKNNIQGINIKRNYKKSIHVSVGGGMNWHSFVLWCIKYGFGGVENLSLIPGTVGAAPIQNIGAYGVELKDVFHQLEAINLNTGKLRIFKKEDCQFGYRDSIFKRKLKGKYFITKVVLKLSKYPTINDSYGAIKKIIEEASIDNPTIKDISDVVIKIRSSKLPDPKVLGNSGSFFKNPVITKSQFLKLQKAFPNIVFYDQPDGKVKVPAGWLIEQCGWKGKRVGNTGSHKNQSLVLVNYGGATGKEVKKIAFKIVASVEKKFGIALTPEVNIIE